MAETKAELRVRGFFERIGFRVERIGVNEKDLRADYLISDGSHSYLLEVKSRDDDKAYVTQLERQGFAEKEASLGRTNSLSAALRDAHKQLLGTPTGRDTFRIIVITASKEDTERDFRQIIGTLYGSVDLLTDDQNGVAIAKTCYYFTFNEFFKMREVDAALIFTNEGSLLLLNTFRHALPRFHQTRLYLQYKERSAVLDPVAEERAGDAMIADCDIDRKEEKAVIRYIEQKYNLEHVIPFKPKMYTATARVRPARMISEPVRHENEVRKPWETIMSDLWGTLTRGWLKYVTIPVFLLGTAILLADSIMKTQIYTSAANFVKTEFIPRYTALSKDENELVTDEEWGVIVADAESEAAAEKARGDFMSVYRLSKHLNAAGQLIWENDIRILRDPTNVGRWVVAIDMFTGQSSENCMHIGIADMIDAEKAADVRGYPLASWLATARLHKFTRAEFERAYGHITNVSGPPKNDYLADKPAETPYDCELGRH